MGRTEFLSIILWFCMIIDRLFIYYQSLEFYAMLLFLIAKQTHIGQFYGCTGCINVFSLFAIDEGGVADIDIAYALHAFYTMRFDGCLCTTADDFVDMDILEMGHKLCFITLWSQCFGIGCSCWPIDIVALENN